MNNTSKKALLVSTRAAIVTAAITAILIAFRYIVGAQASTLSAGFYFKINLPNYWQSLVGISAAVGLFTLLLQAQWTKMKDYVNDFPLSGISAYLLLIVMLSLPVLIAMSDTAFWSAPGVTSDQLVITCWIAAFVAGAMGRGFGISYLILGVGAYILFEGSLIGVIWGLVLMAPMLIGYAINRIVHLLFNRNYEFMKS